MRALRRHHRERLARSRRKVWERVAVPATIESRLSDNELATRHPLDCGNARCGLCHHGKFHEGHRRRDRDKRAWRRDLP